MRRHQPDLDSPEATRAHAAVIARKPFLRRIYLDWYHHILSAVPDGPGGLLEVGSGGGFLKKVAPDVITSDVQALEELDRVLDGRTLPFADGELRAVVMTNVLHHMQDVAGFLGECSRCLRPGGVVSMIEPWSTPWSRPIYRHLHHEPFAPDAGWTLSGGGPLSDANQALPWIVFERDRQRFVQAFPRLAVTRIEPMMPLAYLLSGGLSAPSVLPGAAYGVVRRLDRWLLPSKTGLFAHIVLTAA